MIYVIAVLVVYLVLTLADSRLNIDSLTRLLIGLVIAAIVVLIIAPGISSATPDDRVWYSLLLLFAFLVPILLFVWMLWTQRLSFFNKFIAANAAGSAGKSGPVQVEETLACDANGNNCKVTKRVETRGATRSTKLFSPSQRAASPSSPGRRAVSQ